MSIRYGVSLSSMRPASIVLVLGLLSGCGDRGAALPAVSPAAPSIRLTSPAFIEGGMIPREFTCEGANRSPPLEWSGVPQAARSLALICDDPDAPGGTWSHWVAYNLSPEITSLEQGVEADTVAALEPKIVVKQPRLGVVQGFNDFGKIGYGGPCPPSGVHHYVFRLYALDEQTRLPPGATRATVFKAIEGHILAEGHLIGKYARRS
jgi:Raf kinase inhibitor-like YbhB/YbcL family protein